jgi:hypothetical protein
VDLLSGGSSRGAGIEMVSLDDLMVAGTTRSEWLAGTSTR